MGSETLENAHLIASVSPVNEENICVENEQAVTAPILLELQLKNSEEIQRQTIIRYVSDVHVEHNNEAQVVALQNSIQPTQITDGITEVLVLAGDIGNPYLLSYTSFLKDMDSKFSKIFLLAGNHEYYSHRGSQVSGETIETTNAYIQHLCDTQYKHITFLNDKVELFHSIYFVGTTQWGDLSRINPYVHEINDVHWIRDMTPDLFTSLYQQSVRFLATSLHHIQMNKKQSESVVVITHHQPTHRVIAAKYLTPSYRNYSGWFAGSLDAVMEKYDHLINCWIYGHTHEPSVMRLPKLASSVEQIATPDDGGGGESEMSRCWFVCNPVGYPNENAVVDFDKRVTIVHDDVANKK